MFILKLIQWLYQKISSFIFWAWNVFWDLWPLQLPAALLLSMFWFIPWVNKKNDESMDGNRINEVCIVMTRVQMSEQNLKLDQYKIDYLVKYCTDTYSEIKEKLKQDNGYRAKFYDYVECIKHCSNTQDVEFCDEIADKRLKE